MSELNVSRMNKAQLVEFVASLQTQVQTLEAELASYKPSPNGRKLSQEKADLIRRLHSEGTSKNALSLRFQVSRDSIDAVLRNQIYKVQIQEPEVKAKRTTKAQKPAETKVEPVKKAKIVRTPRKVNTVDELNEAKITRHQMVKAKLTKKAQIETPKEAEVVEIESAKEA